MQQIKLGKLLDGLLRLLECTHMRLWNCGMGGGVDDRGGTVLNRWLRHVFWLYGGGGKMTQLLPPPPFPLSERSPRKKTKFYTCEHRYKLLITEKMTLMKLLLCCSHIHSKSLIQHFYVHPRCWWYYHLTFLSRFSACRKNRLISPGKLTDYYPIGT